MPYQDLSKLSRPELIELHQRINGKGTWAHRARKEDLAIALDASAQQDPDKFAAAMQAQQGQGDPQQGDPQQGDPQQGDPQQGDPQQGQGQGEPQQGEPQQGEPQQAQQDPVPETDDPLEQQVRKLARDEIRKADKGATVDEEQVRGIAASVLAELRPPVRVEFHGHGSNVEPVKVEGQHERFPELAILVSQGINVLMHGPAGSGKTTAAAKLAESMGLDFGVVSLGPQTTQAQLFGYCDAVGNYIQTEFRRRFENGGIILLDEIDRASEKILPSANAAVDNGYCAFPDGMVEKHPDCHFLAAGNTTMQGASRQYNSARKQDGAVVDRWAFLSWGYDLKLEESIAGAYLEGAMLADWLAEVRAVRSTVGMLGLEYIVSPRASRDGAKLIAQGHTDLARSCVLFGGWAPEDVERVKASIVEQAQGSGALDPAQEIGQQ